MSVSTFPTSAKLASGAAVLATAVSLMSGGPSAAAATSSSPTVRPASDGLSDVTFMTQCVSDDYTNRPRRYTLTCADDNQFLDRMTWRGWGAARATARGVITTNLLNSKGVRITKSYPVRVTAHRLVNGEATPKYTRLTVTYTGGRPAGQPRVETYRVGF